MLYRALGEVMLSDSFFYGDLSLVLFVLFVFKVLLLFFQLSLCLQYLIFSSWFPISSIINFYKLKTDKMLKVSVQIETKGPLLQLSRLHNTITGYDGTQNIVQVDTKHLIVSHKRLIYPALTVKCLQHENKHTYFIVNLNRVDIYEGSLISQSNSKAEFTGPIDCRGDSILFAKYHHHYKKYSISYLYDGNKKILKLSDHPIRQTFFHPFNHQIIYACASSVNSFDIENSEKEVSLFQKSTILRDSNNIYFLSLNLQNKSKKEYECGIFDCRNGKRNSSWNSKEIPIKVQSFANNLLVASQSSIEIYDVRKLNQAVERQSVKGVRDFLYEPNVNKLYVGCESRLKVYSFDYQ